MDDRAKPNWDLWKPIEGIELPLVPLWEACAMSLDIEPRSVKFRGDAWMGNTGDFAHDHKRPPAIRPDSFPALALEKEFHRRVQLVQANLSKEHFFSRKEFNGNRAYSHGVSLSEVARFAVHCKWAMPDAMHEVAKSAGVALMNAPEPQAVPVEVASDSVEPATPNWKMRIQTEATALCLRLRKSGASPTKSSILDSMATWCRDNHVMTDGKIFPSANYLRTHVLGGKNWDLPS